MKEQELDELVKRLRAKSKQWVGLSQTPNHVLDNPDGPEAAAAIQSLREQVKGLEKARSFPIIEFHQWDWIPGFAAFIDDGRKFNPASKAFCILNLGSLIAAVKAGEVPVDQVPYMITDSIMHEITHVVEKWAGVEFDEVKVAALTDRYQKAGEPSP